jgi:hypothetical protein
MVNHRGLSLHGGITVLGKIGRILIGLLLAFFVGAFVIMLSISQQGRRMQEQAYIDNETMNATVEKAVGIYEVTLSKGAPLSQIQMKVTSQEEDLVVIEAKEKTLTYSIGFLGDELTRMEGYLTSKEMFEGLSDLTLEVREQGEQGLEGTIRLEVDGRRKPFDLIALPLKQ